MNFQLTSLFHVRERRSCYCGCSEVIISCLFALLLFDYGMIQHLTFFPQIVIVYIENVVILSSAVFCFRLSLVIRSSIAARHFHVQVSIIASYNNSVGYDISYIYIIVSKRSISLYCFNSSCFSLFAQQPLFEHKSSPQKY